MLLPTAIVTCFHNSQSSTKINNIMCIVLYYIHSTLSSSRDSLSASHSHCLLVNISLP